MLKPFAISPREQFTVLTMLLNAPSENKEERSKRRALWDELGVQGIKRKILKIQKPKPAGAPAPDPLNDPDGVYGWQYAEDEPSARVTISQGTLSYLIEKLSGRLEGAMGEILGELCDRLIALRDTADAIAITRTAGTGYKLPRELWTEAEIAADAAPAVAG